MDFLTVFIMVFIFTLVIGLIEGSVNDFGEFVSLALLSLMLTTLLIYSPMTAMWFV